MRVLVPLAVALFLFHPSAGSADNPVLTGDVGLGDAYAISLEDASGAAVTHLDPGTYTLVVHDHSALHNFRLFGPGAGDQVNVATDVGFTGDKTFTIALTPGTYTFNCDPHFTVMKGSFTVGTLPAAPPSPAAVTRLAASVGPGARIAVRGTAGLRAGRAVITVKDASGTDNFRLVGPGVNRATGVAFRGTVKWAATLKAGVYRFRSDRHPTLRGAFTVEV
jgi:hypothetical protein